VGPSVGQSQKPDVVAAKLLEGRVAVFCDGTPHVLTVPQLFVENLQTSEDYYNRTAISAVLRIIRFIALGYQPLLPASSWRPSISIRKCSPPSSSLPWLPPGGYPLPVSFELFFHAAHV
jgi:hypothetical protein